MIWLGTLWLALMWLMFFVLGLLALVFLFRRRGRDSRRDRSAPLVYPPDSARQQVLKSIEAMHGATEGLRGKARVKALRDYMDSMSDGLDLVSEFRPSTGSAPAGEWVIAPGALPERRILYIHGGSWIAGSPRSHRAITDRLSALARACVFAIDYRLMPEHSFMTGVSDCRRGYRWLLENGPDGPEPARFVVVAGDSSGGSHTLSLLAWIRDQKLRAPEAAVALSPSTELMITGLGKRDNIESDPMLGPMVTKLAKIPAPMLWWGTLMGLRVLPTNPVASPLRGPLHNLPPTLIQVSEAEILLDNVRRYAAKARQAGSSVEVQTWPDMVHVWHLFTPLLPEANEAFEEIRLFLERVERDCP
ncbi:Acetyl esterase/lipase [Marinobacter daqiaonensis]|uniref:Acetyl esterase/lipase n=1 Tax=Marinobacter daqiaonensis TaxID=650891 RepID=A0A1I6GR03_9GAMM|nr:alpha/beta hydrolase [Marinobacter daqiaonensis]SFR44618.1 Acetyl esterase/lipase [Marinobacter daqiaonensis]